MFAPPRFVETQTFARLPDRYRLRGRRSAWSETHMRGAELDSFLEGPSFDREGYLWVTDIPHGRIFRVAPDGAFELMAEYDGEPNGLKIDRDGRILIADHAHGILRLDPASGAVEPVCERPVGERFRGCNDLFIAADGDLYFTDQGQSGLHDPTGKVWRLKPDGRLERLIATVPSPNGLVMNRDESQLLVAVTRMNCVWRLPLLGDGTASKVGVFVYLSGGTGPDGMALDAKGDLAVCHAGFGAVWLFSPLGEPLARINSCEGLLTTNCAYGGPDNRTLFITESQSGTILTAELEVAGKPMASHAG